MSGSGVTSTARGIGLSNKTVGGRASAIGIYNNWKSVLDESWETKKTELESYLGLPDGDEQIGDLIKLELTGLSIWIVNEDIKQRNNADKHLASSSLMQYFGSIKEVMKDAFPDLPIWINHDESNQWYNILRTSTTTGVLRRLQQSDDDLLGIKVRPMVRRLGPDLCCIRQRLT